MPRDSILDDAEQSDEDNANESETNSDPNTKTKDDSGGGDDRVRVTQRIPQDLADEVDRVQEEYSLPSRNATINFMLKHASKDL